MSSFWNEANSSTAQPGQPNLVASTSTTPIVRNELQKLLSDQPGTVASAFSFNKPYPTAPDPLLQLTDLPGTTIGQPLSLDDAEKIKGAAIQAPFGMGERTLVDKTVRDMWEIDGSKIRFGNPAWKTFLDQVVMEVCNTLGVNYAASQPRCELYKLLLYETGSHFLPHVDTKKADGMFATLIIILPCTFTGGAAHLSHGSESVIYDSACLGPRSTNILSWYTDVTHEIKPIISGFRLALSYNLLHTTTARRPAFSPIPLSLTDRLDQLMDAWNNEPRAPEKLIYLLEHKYSQANIRKSPWSALKGGDDRKVSMLADLMEKHGFGLGLANVECRLSGQSDDCGGRGSKAKMGFGMIEEREFTFETFVDFEDQDLGDLECDERRELVPANMGTVLQQGKHEKQEYEGYMGNVRYRRTVLVIWPKWSNLKIRYEGDDGFRRLCEAVLDYAKDEGDELAEHALSRALADDPGLAARSVAGYASFAGNMALWVRAVRICAPKVGVGIFEDHDEIEEAVKKFGFDALQESFELMLNYETKNSERLAFLNHKCFQTSQPWVHRKKEEILRALQSPTAYDSAVLLDEVRHRQDGAAFLNEILLPQFLDLGPADFLLAFSKGLSADTSIASGPLKPEIITVLLSTAVSKATLFHRNSNGTGNFTVGRYGQIVAHDGSAEVKKYVQACIDLGHSELIGTIIIERLITDAATMQARDAQDCAQSVMLPLVGFCVERVGCVAREQLDRLRDVAVGRYLEWIANNVARFGKVEMERLIKATVIEGDATVFMSYALPRLLSMQLSAPAVHAIINNLRANEALFSGSAAELDSAIATFAATYIKQFAPKNPMDIITALDWCTSISKPDLISSILQIATELPKSKEVPYINSTLLPLLPLLYKWGVEHDTLDILASFFRRIVSLGLPDVYQGCTEVRTFLLGQDQNIGGAGGKDVLRGDSAQIELVGCGAPSRKHVEGKLKKFATGLANWRVIYEKKQGLSVSKAGPLMKPLEWEANKKKGEAILKSISEDEDVTSGLLGDEYTRFVAALAGNYTGPLSTSVQVFDRTPAPSGSLSGLGQRSAPGLSLGVEPDAKRRRVS